MMLITSQKHPLQKHPVDLSRTRVAYTVERSSKTSSTEHIRWLSDVQSKRVEFEYALVMNLRFGGHHQLFR
jgi:hypothetical protein